jgi:predicted ester cyclase
MPDVKGNVTNAISSGNSVLLEVTWEGTQTGPLETPGGTIPPSGKRQTTLSAWVFEFEGDRIKESRNYFDMVSFLQQIGAME